MFDLLILAPVGCIIALAFAFYLGVSILKKDEGSKEMREIAQAVREGSYAYLKRQYTGVAIFFAVVFCLLLVLAIKKYLVIFVPFAFLTGGFFSGLCRVHACHDDVVQLGKDIRSTMGGVRWIWTRAPELRQLERRAE